MTEFKASVLPEAPATDGWVELFDIQFDLHELHVKVRLYDKKMDKTVTFKEVRGFRDLMKETLVRGGRAFRLNMVGVLK